MSQNIQLLTNIKQFNFMQNKGLLKALNIFLVYPQKFPGYREEKKRCEYLHEKLSYIKQLIIDYDVSEAST